MKKIKVVGLLLLIGVGLTGNSFGSEISDPYIPAMTGMIKDSQQEQKTAEQLEEIKQANNNPKEENIEVKTKKIKVKKKRHINH